MTLTWPVVLAVLFGALLHAAWNALIKSGHAKALDMALLQALGALVALPFALWIGPPPAAAWPYIAASLLTHIGYYIALVGAYRHGELGLTYPIMRGFAPLLVALASASMLGEAPSLAAWLGIAGIAAGVALVGLAHPGDALQHRKRSPSRSRTPRSSRCTPSSTGAARASVGGDPALSALRYVLLLFVLDGVAYPLGVWIRRSAAQRTASAAYARRRWPLALLGAGASIGSYAIALWAMTRAPVASVAALRETSVLFAALLARCC